MSSTLIFSGNRCQNCKACIRPEKCKFGIHAGHDKSTRESCGRELLEKMINDIQGSGKAGSGC
jgi:hypothetical protein